MVLEDANAWDRQLVAFRRTLWLWLGTTLIALTLALLLLLRWGLKPLRLLGRELQQIESGQQPQIQGSYPEEIQPLARDLNTMIAAERSQQTAVRVRSACAFRQPRRDAAGGRRCAACGRAAR